MRQEDRTFLHISIPCEVQRRPRAACLSRCSGPPHGPPKWSPLICERHDSRNCNSTGGKRQLENHCLAKEWGRCGDCSSTFICIQFFFFTIGKRKDNKTIGLCKFTAFYTHDFDTWKIVQHRASIFEVVSWQDPLCRWENEIFAAGFIYNTFFLSHLLFERHVRIQMIFIFSLVNDCHH